MNDWLDIAEYREFHDVPRVFVIHLDGRTFLFDCPFDDDLDEYPDDYAVYEMNEKFLDSLPADWRGIARQAVSCKGKIAVRQVTFDTTKRKQINGRVFKDLQR